MQKENNCKVCPHCQGNRQILGVGYIKADCFVCDGKGFIVDELTENSKEKIFADDSLKEKPATEVNNCVNEVEIKNETEKNTNSEIPGLQITNSARKRGRPRKARNI